MPYRAGIGLDFVDKIEGTLAAVVEDLKGGVEVVLAYNCAVDEYGHLFGPESNILKNSVARIDAYLGTFLANLEAEGLLETTDVVIVSDHGMDSYMGKTKQNIVEGLDDVNDLEKAVEWGQYMMLQVAEGSDPVTVAESINANVGGVQAWASEDIPENLQFQHKNTLDVLVYAERDAIIVGDRDYNDKFIPNSFYIGWSGHGWDDISPNPDSYEEGGYEEMRGIFYAMGPSFRSGYAQEWIKLVDEYQILTWITGTLPEPHSGNWERVQGMFV